MEKLKQGKMDKKTYWIAMGIVCLIIILIAIASNSLGYNGRMAMAVIALAIIFVSAIMRLRDAGKSMVHLLFVFVLPGYMYLIGFYPSEKPLSDEELAQIQAEVDELR